MALAVSGSFTALVVLLCLYGVGASLSQTSQQATLGDALGDRGGSALAANQMVGDIGTILGPMAAGLLLDQCSPLVAMAGGALLLLASTALAPGDAVGRPADECRTVTPWLPSAT